MSLRRHPRRSRTRLNCLGDRSQLPVFEGPVERSKLRVRGLSWFFPRRLFGLQRLSLSSSSLSEPELNQTLDIVEFKKLYPFIQNIELVRKGSISKKRCNLLLTDSK